MVILDLTIVTVALPHIQRALGFSGPNLEWVVNACAVAFGGLAAAWRPVRRPAQPRRQAVWGVIDPKATGHWFTRPTGNVPTASAPSREAPRWPADHPGRAVTMATSRAAASGRPSTP